MDWTQDEVKLVVEDYFKMLRSELDKLSYNKTSYREALYPLLSERSHGAVEFKHQNISAVLIQMGLPFIKGYKPRFNYQQLLEKEIADYLAKNKISLEQDFERFSNSMEDAPQLPSTINFESIINDEPIISQVSEKEPLYRPIKTNYLEKEQNNRRLGEEGEKLIIEYERWQLIKAGKEKLADKIEWVSKDLGDGTGFDILSKNNNGTDKFIEVKTTKLSKETPIFFTRNELSFASSNERDFFLYRVFNFGSHVQFFIKNGQYNSFCKLQPQTYKGFF